MSSVTSVRSVAIHLHENRPLWAVPIYQGAYVATAFPFAARNPAFERPFIVSTVNVTDERFTVIELTRPPSA
jgi:hypothetical protein